VLNDAIAARAFPGCAFGVLAGDEIILQDALGHFTYDQDAPAVTARTVYDVASLTKVVATTAAAMLLYQRDLLDLDTPVGELLPGFVVGRAPAEHALHVKLRHLLAHNSGLPGYVEFFRTVTSPAALFRACLELPLEAEPETRAEYSDPGFILLGKALEVIMRDHLAPWTRREIFQPLQMTATEFCPQPDARVLIPPTEDDTTLLKGVAGHAGVFSNVPDLLRFAREILHANAGPEAEVPRLFKAATVELFSQRQSPEGSSRALGWDTPSEPSSSGRHFSPHSIGHLGYSGCSLWIDMDARVAVALLTNRTWPDRKSHLIRAIRPAFHDAVREAL
jgi:CubicO group peptidase (beta-lactamase class C family)